MVDNSKLFEKYKLNNNVEVPSRLAVAPLSLYGSDPSGHLLDEERQYLAKRATGIGLYILGAAAVSLEGIGIMGQPRALSEKDIPSLAERAKIVKDQGALAICQIVHGGLFGNKQYSGKTPLSPSAEVGNKELEKMGILNDDTRNKDLTNEDVLRIIKDFAYATELAIKAGYDGIEIHAANNFLVQQFYSGYYNKRKDEWGGSLEKRMRFPLEIVDACCKIRDKYNKPEFIIGYRLSPEEPFEDGITMTETLALVRALVKKPIQYIHVSQKNYFQNARRGEGAGTPRLKLIHDEIKGKVALIGVGGLFTEKDINKALISGYTEFIGVGRASMINRDLATLLKEGKGDKIEVEVDDKHPEDYCFTKGIWAMIHQGMDWLPKIKSQ
jgi:2,4-dienoyl-CoA reductase-like NADH-dependent reductase (Old Yellow Enzyme family)